MFAYVVRRILVTIPVMILALYLVHVGVSFTTDPLAPFYQCLPRCQEGYDITVEQYDLDTPLLLRPFSWMADAVTGDLGESNTTNQPVTEVLKTRGWNTAMIAIPAFLITAIVAVLLSVYSATHKYSAGDYFFTGASFVGLALPTFVVGLLLSTVFGVWWQDWFNSKPFYTTGKYDETFGQLLSSITLPIMTLVVVGIAEESRFGRAAMLDVLNADYIRTARSKGVSERRVVWRHGLRNALIPLVTLWALAFSALLSGSVVTESIFSWPGLGPAFLTGLERPDLDLVLGITLFAAFVTVLFNLVADVMYGVLDPRIRFD
jgi:peptide/nickel transport system permease protein